MKMISVDVLDSMFCNKKYKFIQENGKPPTDCVISAWIIKALEDRCKIKFGEVLKYDSEYYTYMGVRLHPCDSECEMYFYRAM